VPDTAPLLAALAAGLDPSRWLPPAAAPYAPLLRDGMLHFLLRLPRRRQREILAAQATLPPAASPERRLAAVLRQSPTLHKLGQVLARDTRLPAALRAQLVPLESLPPQVPMPAIRRELARQLGAVPELRLDRKPLAEASVAVVIRFRWPASGDLPEQGVLKLLKPGIEQRLTEDLRAWSELAAFLEQRGAELDLPPLDYRDTLDGVARQLRQELDLRGERRNLRAFAEASAHAADLTVPRLLPFCGERVTAMEYLPGPTLARARLAPARARAAAAALCRELLARPFWSAREALFHADPHAGNLLALPDGRIGVLDWSLITRLSKEQREQMVQLALAALTEDAAAVCRAIAALAGQPPAEQPLRAAVEEWLAQWRRTRRLPDMDGLLALLDRVAQTARPAFPEELTLFRKAVHTLRGVCASLGAPESLDDALLRGAAAAVLPELPWRGFAPPLSRAFASHLSTTDLWRAMLGLQRHWIRRWWGLP